MTLNDMDAVMVIQKMQKVFDSCDTRQQADIAFRWNKMLIRSWIKQSGLSKDIVLLVSNDLLTRCKSMACYIDVKGTLV